MFPKTRQPQPGSSRSSDLVVGDWHLLQYDLYCSIFIYSKCSARMSKSCTSLIFLTVQAYLVSSVIENSMAASFSCDNVCAKTGIGVNKVLSLLERILARQRGEFSSTWIVAFSFSNPGAVILRSGHDFSQREKFSESRMTCFPQ